MDFPERLIPKVKSRLGDLRITFPAYTAANLKEILLSRLRDARAVTSFDADAITFAAAKVANMHGDARRLLDLCHAAARTVEAIAIAGTSRAGDDDDVTNRARPVGCNDVLAAIERMFGSPVLFALQHLPLRVQLYIAALVRELQFSSDGTATHGGVVARLNAFLEQENMELMEAWEEGCVTEQLEANGLVTFGDRRRGVTCMVSLPMVADEVIFALSAAVELCRQLLTSAPPAAPTATDDEAVAAMLAEYT